MQVILVILGALVGILGVVGVLQPQRVSAWVTSFWQEDNLGLAVGMRLAFGAVLVVAASECRWPQLIRALGLLNLISAAALVALGKERVQAFVAKWVDLSPTLKRVWSCAAVVYGAVLIYAGL